MMHDSIAEVGIDEGGRLYVRPSATSFELIYRVAMEVNWDASKRRLFGPKPLEWDYVDWFKQIVAAAANEYGVALTVTSDTDWSNIPATLQAQIEGLVHH